MYLYIYASQHMYHQILVNFMCSI